MSNAKAVLEWMSCLLIEQGIRVDPETLRQAKFNSSNASGSLWRALHDITLLRLWQQQSRGSSHVLDEKASNAQQRIREVWREIESEEGAKANGTFVPREAALMTCHYLASWGCPSRLVTILRSHLKTPAEGKIGEREDGSDCVAGRTPSRTLLLSLAWLVSHCQIIHNSLQQLYQSTLARLESLLTLPPFPEDSCNMRSVQSAYTEALNQGREFVSKVAQTIERMQVVNFDAKDKRLKHISDPEGRRRNDDDEEEDQWLSVEVSSHQAVMMLGKVKALLGSHQSLCDARLRLQLGVRQAQALSSSSSFSSNTSLSPLEVHLLSSQKVMEEQLLTLDKATDVVVQITEASKCARQWFAWLSSVISEDLKSPSDPSFLPRGPGSDGAAVAMEVSVEGWEALASLPPAGSTKAISILSAMDERLQETVKNAAPHFAMARAEAKKKKQQVHPTGSKGISMLSFISLAERSMILNKMRSKGLVEEEAVGTGATLRDEERRRREEDLVKLASCLSHFDLGFRPIGGGDTSKAKVPNQKTLGPGGAEEKDGGWVGGAFGGRSMDPEAETGRLVSLSLNVSKALARTRTENKAAIAQALSQSEGTEDFIRL